MRSSRSIALRGGGWNESNDKDSLVTSASKLPASSNPNHPHHKWFLRAADRESFSGYLEFKCIKHVPDWGSLEEMRQSEAGREFYSCFVEELAIQKYYKREHELQRLLNLLPEDHPFYGKIAEALASGKSSPPAMQDYYSQTNPDEWFTILQTNPARIVGGELGRLPPSGNPNHIQHEAFKSGADGRQFTACLEDLCKSLPAGLRLERMKCDTEGQEIIVCVVESILIQKYYGREQELRQLLTRRCNPFHRIHSR
jgi:hypothetical protein